MARMLMFSPVGVSSWGNFFSGQNGPCSWLDNPPLEFSFFGQTLMAVGLAADMKTANFVTVRHEHSCRERCPTQAFPVIGIVEVDGPEI
jgi:hypothetical protein